MFELIHDFLQMEVTGGLKVAHFWPVFVVGPIVLFALYSMGLKDIINPTPKVREIKRLQKLERERQKEERKISEKVQKGREDTCKVELTPTRLAFQAVLFMLFATVIGYLSNSPSYTRVKQDEAMIKLSMSLPGKRKEECRKRTKEELAKLPPNMRAPMQCSRERWPVYSEFKMNGGTLYKEDIPPTGLSKDGQSSFYQNFIVPAGMHTLFLGVRDKGGKEEFDYVFEEKIVIEPAKVLVLSFNTVSGKIYIK